MAKVSLRSLVSDNDDDSATEPPTEEHSSTKQPSVTVTELADAAGEEGGGTAPRRRPHKRVKKIATVYTTDAVFQRLREYVSSRKAKGDILSYGIASLLAVRHHRHELSRLWLSGTASEGSASANIDLDDDLFGITVRKAAPKKVPWQLHGASPSQVEMLDDLANQWGAPSRSVLVEEALSRYLPRPARKSPAKTNSPG